MKKWIMALVCLMTMVLNVSAQNDYLYDSVLEDLAIRNYDSKKTNYEGVWNSIDEDAIVKISDSNISITKFGETFVIKYSKNKRPSKYYPSKYYTEVKIPVYGVKKITLFVNFHKLVDGLATLTIQSVQSDVRIHHTYKLIKDDYRFSKQ